LKTIYAHVKDIRIESNLSWSDSSEAIIRRELEQNSSDSKSWKGENDLFQNDEIGSGIWSIKSNSLHNNVNSNLRTTERIALTNAKNGQGKYRKDLIQLWNSACSVTKLGITQILIASHIKPWKDSTNYERLDPNNGLLLTPNLDKLFDRGFISFNDNGNIKISKNIPLSDYQLLGINKNMKVTLSNNHKKYMSFHRENIFI